MSSQDARIDNISVTSFAENLAIFSNILNARQITDLEM